MSKIKHISRTTLRKRAWSLQSEYIRRLEKGKDLAGNDLDGGVSFCAGAIVTPEANPLEPQLIKFEKKIEVGVEFIQTQAVYDLDRFKQFMEYARQFPAKILAGIILLTSAIRLMPMWARKESKD